MFRHVWKLEGTNSAQFHLSPGKFELKPQCDTYQSEMENTKVAKSWRYAVTTYASQIHKLVQPLLKTVSIY